MRIHLVLLTLVATLLVAAPLASAQMQSSLTITMSPLTEDVRPGAPTMLTAKVDFYADASAALHTSGIPIYYAVEDAPSWATVLVTPASDVLTPYAWGPTLRDSRMFNVIISVSDSAPHMMPETLTVRAIVPPTSTHAGTSSIVTIPIRADMTGCSDGTMHAQGQAPRIVDASPGVAGVALMGVGVVAIFAGVAALTARAASRPRAAMLGIVVGLLVIGLAAVPTAAAMPSSTLTMSVLPFAESVERGDSITTIAHVTYASDATAMTATSGIPIRYVVAQQPAWAVVTLSPSSDVLHPSGTGQTMMAAAKIAITVTLTQDAPDNALDLLEIRAHTDHTLLHAGTTASGHVATPPIAGSTGCAQRESTMQTQAPAQTDRTLGENPAEARAPARAADAPDATPLAVQSAPSLLERAGWTSVAGFGLMGAGLGLLMHRRTR